MLTLDVALNLGISSACGSQNTTNDGAICKNAKKNSNHKTELRARTKAILASDAKMAKCSADPGGEEGNTMNISNG